MKPRSSAFFAHTSYELTVTFDAARFACEGRAVCGTVRLPEAVGGRPGL
jgi:hypothetical protein